MKQQNKPKTVKRILLSIALFATLAILATMVHIAIVAFSVQLDKNKLISQNKSVSVIAIDGTEMMSNTDYVTIDEIPEYLKQAFVAVEDKRFYTHRGIDPVRIGGAIVHNIKNGKNAQGASTISCQLIKNTHLSGEKTLNRKIKEAKLAIDLENNYTKDEILEMYLNVIYFGNGLYGVGNAAKGFFGKETKDLSLVECAAIAATTANPAQYSPKLKPENNRDRRNMVLQLMCKQGYIHQHEYDSAKTAEIALVDTHSKLYETYCINAIDEAERMTGLSYATLSQGYTIQTYCNPQEQATCIRDMTDTDEMRLLANTNGEICAFASTYTLRQSGIRRQPGSTIKPFIYACAIEKGILLPDSMIEDNPTTFGDYTPHNYKNVYYGSITACEALAKSSNIAACKVLQYANIDDCYTFCTQCGIPLSTQDKHTALALGGLTYGVTADEMIASYCILANGGKYRPARFVRAILAPDNNIVYQDNCDAKQVMGADTAYLITSMLQQSCSIGTAKSLGALSGEVAAKTGTVGGKQGNSDAWCIAYNQNYVAVCWQGNLDMKQEHDIKTSGGGTPTIAVKTILCTHSGYQFNKPETVYSIEIDEYTLQNKGIICAASDNTPIKYRKQVLCNDRYYMHNSETFEKPLQPQAEIKKEGDQVGLTLEAESIYTYYVVVDDGNGTRLVDILEGKGNIYKSYSNLIGEWQIRAILHGNIDLDAPPYRRFVV